MVPSAGPASRIHGITVLRIHVMNQWPGPPLRATTPGRRPDPSGWPRLRRPKKPALLAGEEACERSDRPTRDTPPTSGLAEATRPPRTAGFGGGGAPTILTLRGGRVPSTLHTATPQPKQRRGIRYSQSASTSRHGAAPRRAWPSRPSRLESLGGGLSTQPGVQCPWCLPGVCALLIPHTAQLGHSGAERPEHPRGSHPSFRLTLFGAASRGPLALRRVRTHPPG